MKRRPKKKKIRELTLGKKKWVAEDVQGPKLFFNGHSNVNLSCPGSKVNFSGKKSQQKGIEPGLHSLRPMSTGETMPSVVFISQTRLHRHKFC